MRIMGYIDPGMFGMISQIGYMILFAVVSSFMFFFQPLKDLINRVRGKNQRPLAQADNEDPTSLKNTGA